MEVLVSFKTLSYTVDGSNDYSTALSFNLPDYVDKRMSEEKMRSLMIQLVLATTTWLDVGRLLRRACTSIDWECGEWAERVVVPGLPKPEISLRPRRVLPLRQSPYSASIAQGYSTSLLPETKPGEIW